jgi:hypothetical protein
LPFFQVFPPHGPAPPRLFIISSGFSQYAIFFLYIFQIPGISRGIGQKRIGKRIRSTIYTPGSHERSIKQNGRKLIIGLLVLISRGGVVFSYCAPITIASGLVVGSVSATTVILLVESSQRHFLLSIASLSQPRPFSAEVSIVHFLYGWHTRESPLF